MSVRFLPLQLFFFIDMFLKSSPGHFNVQPKLSTSVVKFTNINLTELFLEDMLELQGQRVVVGGTNF